MRSIIERHEPLSALAVVSYSYPHPLIVRSPKHRRRVPETRFSFSNWLQSTVHTLLMHKVLNARRETELAPGIGMRTLVRQLVLDPDVGFERRFLDERFAALFMCTFVWANSRVATHVTAEVAGLLENSRAFAASVLFGGSVVILPKSKHEYIRLNGVC